MKIYRRILPILLGLAVLVPGSALAQTQQHHDHSKMKMMPMQSKLKKKIAKKPAQQSKKKRIAAKHSGKHHHRHHHGHHM